MITPQTKQALYGRLKRAAGQVNGVQRMIEQDRYCVDILMQIAAVQAALAKVSGLVLEAHIQTCVTDALSSDDPDDRAAKIAELMRVFEKTL